MGKKEIIQGMQLIALLIFTVMALACATQSTAVDAITGGGGEAGNSSGTNEGAAIEVPADSITSSNDLALL